MATLDWPELWLPQSCSFQLMRSSKQFASPLNGTMQVVDFPGERWMMSATLPERRRSAGLQSFLNRLAGGVNLVRVWPFHMKGVPRGTLRGAPTLGASAAQFDTQLTITGGSPLGGSGPKTLLADDFIAVGGQLFQVAADTTISGPTVVPVVNRVRASIANGTAVTWDRPTCDMLIPAAQLGPLFDASGTRRAEIDAIEFF